MGTVWCKADKGENRCFGLKTNYINKWTNQVCQVYKRPKDVHRPPRPSSRVGERPTISHPHPLSFEINHKGWQSPALIVPNYTPVPPPRTKRKNRLEELQRKSRSMNYLNLHGSLEQSTISLPDMIDSDELSRQSSTFVIKPDIENNDYEVLKKCDSENVPQKPARRDFQSQQTYYDIPLNTSQSGVGKLSDISEELTNYDEIQNKTVDGTSMNILKHIYNISNVSKLPRASEDVNVEPKAAWLQNILTTDESTNNPDKRSDRNHRLHLMNGEADANTPPTTPSYDNEAAHSVLLEILKKHSKNKKEATVEATETKDFRTNSIYKSSSTNKLSDESFINSFSKTKSFKTANKSYVSTPPLLRRHTYHSDLFRASKLIDEQKKEDSLSDDDKYKTPTNQSTTNPYKDCIGSTNRSYVSALRELDCIQTKQIEVSPEKLKYLSEKSTESGLVIKPLRETNEDKKPSSSPPLSRTSSITDSLHEFEMSIYDMLKESKKSESSEDEEVRKTKVKV